MGKPEDRTREIEVASQSIVGECISSLKKEGVKHPTISGCLMGLEETKISLQLENGEIKTYPRKDLDITLQWVFDNMGQLVVCSLENGVVVNIVKPS